MENEKVLESIAEGQEKEHPILYLSVMLLEPQLGGVMTRKEGH